MNTSIRVSIRSWDVVGPLPDDISLDDIMGKPIVVEVKAGTDVLGIFTKLPWLGRPLDDTAIY